MHETGPYCVFRNVERRSVQNPAAPTDSDKLLNSKSVEQAKYFQNISGINHHVPLSLLQEHLYESLVVSNDQLQSRRRYAVDSRVLGCSHGSEQLLVFATGKHFTELVVKPVIDCMSTPSSRNGLFCQGFSYDVRGFTTGGPRGGGAASGLTDGPLGSVSFIGRDRSTWGEANAAHLLAASRQGLLHLKTVRLPAERGRGHAFSTILEPLQQWRLSEHVKQVATFESPHSLGCGFGGTHVASVLTEEGHIFQWDPQGGVRVSPGPLAPTALENSRRYACLEYSDHMQVLHLALGGSVYACDHRCGGPAGPGLSKVYALDPCEGGSGGSSGTIYSVKRSPGPGAHPHQCYLSTSGGEVLLADLRFPRGHVSRRLVGAGHASGGEEVYKHLTLGPSGRDSGDAALLLGAVSSRVEAGNVPSGSIDVHTVRSGGVAAPGDSVALSDFLCLGRPYGLANACGFGGKWQTSSFWVADALQRGNAPLPARSSNRRSGVEPQGASVVGTGGVLSGLALLDVSAECEAARREVAGDADPDVRAGAGSGCRLGRYLLCHQLDSWGDLYVEATDLADPGAEEPWVLGTGVGVSGNGSGSSASSGAEPAKRRRSSSGAPPDPPGLYLTSGLEPAPGLGGVGSTAVTPLGVQLPKLSAGIDADCLGVVPLTMDLLRGEAPVWRHAAGVGMDSGGRRRGGRVPTFPEARRREVQRLAGVFLDYFHGVDGESDALVVGQGRRRGESKRPRAWWRVLGAHAQDARWEDAPGCVERLASVAELHECVWAAARRHGSATATNAARPQFSSFSDPAVRRRGPLHNTDLYNPPILASVDSMDSLAGAADGLGGGMNAVYEFIAGARLSVAAPAAVLGLDPPAAVSSGGGRVTLWEVTKYLNSHVLPFVRLAGLDADVAAPPRRPVATPALVRAYLRSELFTDSIGTAPAVVETEASYCRESAAGLGDGLAIARTQWSEPTEQARPCSCAQGLGRVAGAGADICAVEWGAISACPAPHLIAFSIAVGGPAVRPPSSQGSLSVPFPGSSQDSYGAFSGSIASGRSDVTSDIISSLQGVW